MRYLSIGDFIKRIKLFFLCYSNQKKFFKLFENKSVAIVGNAESIFENKQGKEIDSHDIVIRFNNGFIKNAESQGSKTTIWATSFFIEEEELFNKFPDIKHIIWLTPKLSLMQSYSNRIYKMMNIYPIVEWYKLFKKLNKARPTSGCMLIDYISQKTKFKKIDIYGFDFFKTNSFYNVTELNTLKNQTPHNFQSEESYVKFLMENFENISLEK